jgi:tungstate transport system substrate-binding protein
VASNVTRPLQSPDANGGCSRRDLLAGAGATAVGVGTMLLAACTPGGPARPSGQGRSQTTAPHGPLRLLSVPTVSDGGEWSELLPAFTHQTGIEVKLQIADMDLYDRARRGEADLVYSHYGHRDVGAFVLGGYGQWPRTVLFNVIVLLGPPADPAGVRGLSDLTEAFRRIAASGSTFEVNGIPELVYLSKIVLQAGGIGSGAWYVDEGLRQGSAVERASARGAYILWGVTPFLKLTGQKPLQLTPLVTADPILQRIMVSIVVNPDKVRGANVSAARSLQDYLLSTAAQAQVRAFRHPQLGIPIFFPAGRDNEAAALPVG